MTKYFLIGLLICIRFTLSAQSDTTYDLNTMDVYGQKKENINSQNGISKSGILLEGKKNFFITPANIPVNITINNARTSYAKIPGLNIVENDGAGIQMGIGTRGLNPNRILEFNTRQNGYDIAADALGYPENYYTPTLSFVKQIEIIRGAAGLQFGPQFGGLINFQMMEPDLTKEYRIKSFGSIIRTAIALGKESKRTLTKADSTEIINKAINQNFLLMPKFNISYGTKGFRSNDIIFEGGYKRKSNSLGYYPLQYIIGWNNKRGDGWRQNSLFRNNNIFASIKWTPENHFKNGYAKLDLTFMDYSMQQPGGLTDNQFNNNPQTSLRPRNWFSATWFIPALEVHKKLNTHWTSNLKVFSLVAQRSSIGNLIPPNQSDYRPDRNLMIDHYFNLGSELRFFNTDYLGKRKHKNIFVSGLRYYHGQTTRKQGLGDSLNNPNYTFLHPNNLENSSFKFPSSNMAGFIENVYYAHPNFSITPGIRYEFIQTNSNGYYQTDTGKGIDNKTSNRSFPLLGIGLTYYLNKSHNLGNIYFNFSQSYNAVNFNDIRVVNQNLKVDANLKDVTGFNADLGLRTKISQFLFLDFSVYYLAYNNRIGVIYKVDNQFNIYQFRTNIADSRSLGTELLVQLELFQLLKYYGHGHLNLYNSYSFNDSRYINTPNISVKNKFVEYAPQYINRSGIEYSVGSTKIGLQSSYVSGQYTDAQNTEFALNGITGYIPAYFVMDATVSYKYKSGIRWTLSLNNLLDHKYFNRRTDGYPGPGILPSDGRMGYLTASFRL